MYDNPKDTLPAPKEFNEERCPEMLNKDFSKMRLKN